MMRSVFASVLASAVAASSDSSTSAYPQIFYEALNRGDLWAVVDLFAENAIYAHTGLPTATSRDQLVNLFQSMFNAGVVNQMPKVLDTQIAGGADGSAQAFIATRRGFPGEDAVRDVLFVADGKIKAMMTTHSSPKDPHVTPDARTNIAFAPISHNAQEMQAVKDTIDVYFDGFAALNPEKMQSVYAQDLFYMFDFSPARHVPFGCAVDPGFCFRAPFYTKKEQLLPAFQGFAQGYVNLNHKFETVAVYGHLALVTTVSFGCEGDNVTPKGSKAMPNREHFVLLKTNGVWTIHSYMFTYDPDSPIKPPVGTCPPTNGDAIIV